MSFFGEASKKKFGGSSSSNILNKKRNKPEGQSSEMAINAPNKVNRNNPPNETDIPSFTSNTVLPYDTASEPHDHDSRSRELNSNNQEEIDEQVQVQVQVQANKLSIQIDNHSHTSNDHNENEMEVDVQNHVVSPLINTEYSLQTNILSSTPFEEHDWKDFDVETIEILIKNSSNDLVQYKKLLEEGTRKLEKYTHDINDKVYSILYTCDSTTLLPSIISTNKKLNDLLQKLENVTTKNE